MFRTVPRMAGFVFRENRVPYYQRLFQQHDGKRQWWKTDRSKYIMYPYLLSVYGLGIATTYAMCRMVLTSWFERKYHDVVYKISQGINGRVGQSVQMIRRVIPIEP
ncbi:hypothetical protein GB937_000835 [Aspergillus fischeri]|nr:hypothetical protein GB937_000835 [Aspergillus fischeri]